MGVGEELFRGNTSAKRGRGGRGVEVFIVALLCEAKFDKLKSDVCEKVTFGSASSTEPLLPPLLPSYSLCSFFSASRADKGFTPRRLISACRVCTAFAPHRTHK